MWSQITFSPSFAPLLQLSFLHFYVPVTLTFYILCFINAGMFKSSLLHTPSCSQWWCSTITGLSCTMPKKPICWIKPRLVGEVDEEISQSPVCSFVSCPLDVLIILEWKLFREAKKCSSLSKYFCGSWVVLAMNKPSSLKLISAKSFHFISLSLSLQTSKLSYT